MKWALRIMRVMVILLFALFALDYIFKWDVSDSLVPCAFIFLIVYIFTSMTNMLIRFKSQHKYAYRPRRESESEDETAKDKEP